MQLKDSNVLKADGTYIQPAEVTEPYARVFFQRMQAFGFGFMQDVMSFFYILEKKKIPIEHALGAIKLRQELTDRQWTQDIRNRQQWQKMARRCPRCGATLNFAPINAPEGPGNVKGYKGRWYCITGWSEDDPENICGYEAFTHKTLNYYLKKYGIKQRI